MRRATFLIGWSALVLLLFVPLICAQMQTLHPGGESKPQEPLPDGVYKIGRGVKAPRAKYTPEPEFSEQARKAGYEGVCVLKLIVDAEGMPQNITVERHVGMGLDDKAIATVQQWRFAPALKDGEPVAVQIDVEVNFHLYSQNAPSLFSKANSGDAKAQFEISKILLSDPALQNDDSKGFSYLEKSARQNFPPAQFAMGEYFSTRKNDLVRAYVWYALARKNRYKQSDEKLKDLAEKMTPDQLSEARQRAESQAPF